MFNVEHRIIGEKKKKKKEKKAEEEVLQVQKRQLPKGQKMTACRVGIFG